MPKEKSTEKKDDRVRNWMFIQYDDSAPQNWRGILDDLHIPWVESPLHEADQNGDGSEKKPHRHILLFFEGNKSFEQIQEITQLINSPIPKPVKSARAMSRYLIHLDNPEKAQYKQSDIICHGGADVSEFFITSEAANRLAVGEMVEWIEENDIREFRRLAIHAWLFKREEWHGVLLKTVYYFKEYINSRRNEIREAEYKNE